MILTEEEKQAIMQYRLDKANDSLIDVTFAVQNKRWNNAANRLYYACYYAVSALLINDGHEAKTHNGAKAIFGLRYVKTGIISEDLSDAYRKMFNLRQTGDYDDLFQVTKDDVAPLVEKAKTFIDTIEKLILTK